MATQPINNVCNAFGATKNDFSNMKIRGVFITPFAKGTPGQPLQLSRENALEFGFRLMLNATGQEQGSREATIKLLLRAAKNPKSSEMIWACNPTKQASRGGHHEAFAEGDLVPTRASLLDLLRGLPDTDESGWAQGQKRIQPVASALIIVNVGEVVRRVDELFKGH